MCSLGWLLSGCSETPSPTMGGRAIWGYLLKEGEEEGAGAGLRERWELPPIG